MVLQSADHNARRIAAVASCMRYKYNYKFEARSLQRSLALLIAFPAAESLMLLTSDIERSKICNANCDIPWDGSCDFKYQWRLACSGCVGFDPDIVGVGVRSFCS